MSMSKQVLDKIARNLEILGYTITRGSANEVINGAVTLAYADSSTTPSFLGGVDGTVSPFLGIGQGNPGKITLRVASANSLATVLVAAPAIVSFSVAAGHANNIQLLRDDTGAVVLEVRGQSDLIGMGQ